MTDGSTTRPRAASRRLSASTAAVVMVAVSVALVTAQPVEPGAAAVSGSISGTVIREFNGDGDGDLDATVTAATATDVDGQASRGLRASMKASM